MSYPNRRQEKKLRRHGFKLVAGTDEVGKGSWAGPIVAAAVILDPKIKISGIKDSKLLRRPDRERLFEEITSNALAWAVGQVSSKMIDRIGITKANHLAMIRSLERLLPQPDYILIDAVKLEYQSVPTTAVINGDHKITSIAAASIVAKVARDRFMDRLDEDFPHYGFKQHKGYGTSHHFQMITEYGVSDIHRHSFKPMRDFING